MRKCLIISFDFTKPDYPPISYSIASILAKFKGSEQIEMEHYSYDLRNFWDSRTPKNIIECEIVEHFKGQYLGRINEFSFIALAAYAWSQNLVKILLNLLRPGFEGRIIEGGYEITALSDEELVNTYPGVDYFIKGFAEDALEGIFNGTMEGPVVECELNIDNLPSPYLSGVLPTKAKKIHWESKRGCRYRCGFCEWGNAAKKKVYRIPDERIDKEIEHFKAMQVEEINIIDAIFFLKRTDIEILKKLLSIPHVKVTMQARFEKLNSPIGDEFISLCARYRNRISLEFGLQTIHENEMNILKRNNNLGAIEETMFKLNQEKISYWVSVIFGIPGQTIDSFDQTIEFLRKNGCFNYEAFPLRMPKNSDLSRGNKELGIKEQQGFSTSLLYVNESNSFSNEDWKKMCEKAGEPYIGDPAERRIPYFDMHFEKLAKFIYLRERMYRYIAEKEVDITDLTFDDGKTRITLNKINTIQIKNYLKYNYFQGDIYDPLTNEKCRIALADSGNVYVLLPPII